MPEQPPPQLPWTSGAGRSGDLLVEPLATGLVVYRLDVSGDPESLRLELMNPAASRMLGVTADEVLGRRLVEIFPQETGAVIPELMCEVIESGRGLTLDAAPFQHGAGGDGSFDVHLFALPGQRCGVEFSDATGRLRRERALEATTRELRNALESLWSERTVAHKLQHSLVPADGARIPGYDCAARMHTAPLVGGDYVDAFEINGTGWMFVGDVSGRDLPASLLASLVQTSARSVISALELQGIQPRPSVVMEAINRAMGAAFRIIDSDQYMTLTAIRVRGGRVMHAGLHQDLLVHRAATDTLDRFESEGLWLGVITEGRLDLNDQEFQMAEGDTLLLFTDGLIDPLNGAGGQRALEAGFLELAGTRMPVADLAQAILERRVVDPVRDDCTLLVARRRSRGDAH